MNKLLIYILLFFGISVSKGQEYIVNAPNGLIVRDKPNGKKLSKIFYGAKINVTKKLDAFTVTDNGKEIKGNWVQAAIQHSNYETESGFDTSKFYVFNGFLTPINSFIDEQEKIIGKHAALKDFYLAKDYNVFAIKGDFFGDGIQDNLYRMIDKNGKVRLMIINNQQSGSQIYGLGGSKDPFEIDDYTFGQLSRVPKGTPLWSNYVDDFRDLKDVPKNEIVKLNYDAIFVHIDEGCGGGFIFWKNNKWNWLQQE